MNSEAIAGPSTLSPTAPPSSTMLYPSSSSTTHSSAPPLLFLPPPLAAPHPPKQHLASTQDLLSRFHLLPAYNTYVRPPLLPDADGGDDDDDAGGKGEKKKKNTYKHLIKGIPGKHSLKKDDSLTKLMLVPPKQRMRIAHFDLRTQEEAFTVSLEGLKGWNINTLILESAQAREDRKKRKELKRLAKLQAQQGVPSQTAVLPTGLAAQPPPQPPPPQALTTNGYGSGIGPPMLSVNSRAGTAGIRPRPIKKQKMDVQGQARDVTAPVQQLTPQGV